MQALTDNHFAVLTAVAAPAVLTNASSVLCLGIGNRIARVVDRTRAVSIAIAEVGTQDELRNLLQHELLLLGRRARFLVAALRLGYAGLGGFAAEALVAVIGGVLGSSQYHHLAQGAAFSALFIGVASVGAFVASCVYMVRETLIALTNLEQESAALKMHRTHLRSKPER
jgi:hypothetical protein